MTTMNIILIAYMGFMVFVQIYHFVMLETRKKSLDRLNGFIDDIEAYDEKTAVLNHRIDKLWYRRETE